MTADSRHEERLFDACVRSRDNGSEPVGGEDLDTLLAELRAVDGALGDPPLPPPELLSGTLRSAQAELAARGRDRALLRELVQLLLATAPPVAFVVAWNAAVWWFVPGLLEPWLPAPLPRLLAAAYVFGATGWLAVVYGSLPALAHLGLVRRQREALA